MFKINLLLLRPETECAGSALPQVSGCNTSDTALITGKLVKKNYPYWNTSDTALITGKLVKKNYPYWNTSDTALPTGLLMKIFKQKYITNPTPIKDYWHYIQ